MKPGAPLDDVAGTRLPLLEQPNSERRVSRNARNGPTLRRQRQSNMQFAAEMPIAVAVIGFCPIPRIFVAPTTKSGGTAKTASDANRRVALARIRSRRCLLYSLADASRPHWKQRASLWAGWTPSEHCRPTRVRSCVVAFARRRSSQREPGSRGCCRRSNPLGGGDGKRPAR